MTDDKFGELRSLLQQAPSKKSWSKVLAWCEANATMLEREDVATYLDDMLKAWPKRLERLISPQLLKSLLFKPAHVHPWMSHVSGIILDDDFGFGFGAENEARKAALISWVHAPQVRVLCLGADDTRCEGGVAEFAAVLSQHKPWQGVRVVKIYSKWLDDETMLNLGQLNLPNLDVLHLGGFLQFSPAGVDEFCRGEHLPKHISKTLPYPPRDRWDDAFQCWE